MPASNPRKRPVVQTTGIKLGLTLAAIGASIAGWAAMGIAEQNTSTSVAQASSNAQPAALPAPPQTPPDNAVVVPPTTDVAPAPLPQDNTFTQPSPFGRSLARTRSSR